MPRIPRGAVPSPNIWHNPQIYELENRAVDPDGVIDSAIQGVRTWVDATILDIGCGTGYHLPGYAATARQVIGVEPHPELAALAIRRCAPLRNVSVQVSTAQALPVPDTSVDVAVARWAYFFGPGCEPGLKELSRAVRRGGAAFVVDLDASRGAFGEWFRESAPTYSVRTVEEFWSRQGWERVTLDPRMVFARRSELEAVLRIEFTPAVAKRAIRETAGVEIPYPTILRWRAF
ncbi:methyltransferase type 11 [Acrocarpospora corrugata]|uniref:Methyltransferase type 11 n=1 Tax=Acrocarpospora corrugata TaxID=35763 RepID=A0A5M3WBK6_9ACTN|nr:class I SAM-dependent methyltransferase [Acrocarpospora corrugata]GES06206.1 methyltransferase type 11 [Acrocarpospora corrugata]